MRIKTVCGSGLGTSLLVEMNIKSILDANGFDYESVEHTNISSFTPSEVDLLVVGLDVYPSIEFPIEKTVILTNILSREELEGKLKEKLNF